MNARYSFARARDFSSVSGISLERENLPRPGTTVAENGLAEERSDRARIYNEYRGRRASRYNGMITE